MATKKAGGAPARATQVGGGLEFGDVMLAGFRCRCGHEWLARNKGERPRVCPKCKSANWDRGYRNQYAATSE